VGHRAHRSEDELADELEALMADAFGLRLIADVPVGVFLSGGVDSSVLAALLQRHGGAGTIKTYTVGFDVPEFDEAPYAAAVAQHLGTEHHERRLRVDDAKALLPRWGELFDEPFGDSSGLPTLMVSQAAAEQVKVVLSADGGDELFSGYNNYATILAQWERVKGLPQGLRTLSADVLRGVGVPALARHLGPGGALGSTVNRMAHIAGRLDARSVGGLFDLSLAHFPADELRRLTGRAPAQRPLADLLPGEPGEQLCLWDLQHYLPGDVLTKVDRATMACSIEGREPLLDHRLVEFAVSLPFHLRRGALGGKHLLKKVLYRHVPRELVDRPKRGFAVPIRRWLAGDLAPLVDEHLDPRSVTAQGLFDPEMVQDYVKRLRQGDESVAQRVWLLLAFQLWHRRWMAQA
jgi:asparagine synthase (glutamine-hydrolysing)